MEQILSEILNHIATLNDDYTKLAVDVAVLQSQVGELVWWFRCTAGAIIVMLITQFWQIRKIRNNGK